MITRQTLQQAERYWEDLPIIQAQIGELEALIANGTDAVEVEWESTSARLCVVRLMVPTTTVLARAIAERDKATPWLTERGFALTRDAE